MKRELAWIREGECIRCTSHALDNGYPKMWRNGKPRKIARLILIRRLGDIPGSVVSRHTCDNRWCIRPDHIISGTRSDNNRDRLERGKYAKNLTPAQVRQIREATGLQREIAERFGISQQSVSDILNRKLWRHI